MPLPEGQGHVEEQIVVGMFDRGLLGFLEDPLKLKSGRMSHYYFDDRPSLSFDRTLEETGRMTIDEQRDFRRALVGGFATALGSLADDVDFDHVFGKAEAGTAPVAVAAYEGGFSYLWERVKPKDYGKSKPIQGDYVNGERVAIGDDVITDGKSKVEGADVLVKNSLEPVGIAVKLDRQEGGFPYMEDLGYATASVTNTSNVARILVDNGRIGAQQVDQLAEYYESLRADGVRTTYDFEG